VACPQGEINFWKINTDYEGVLASSWKVGQTIITSEGPIEHIAFASQGEGMVAFAGPDNWVYMLNVMANEDRSLEEIVDLNFMGSSAKIEDMALNSDGSLLSLVSSNLLYVWDIDPTPLINQSLEYQIEYELSDVSYLFFAPDDQTLTFLDSWGVWSVDIPSGDTQLLVDSLDTGKIDVVSPSTHPFALKRETGNDYRLWNLLENQSFGSLISDAPGSVEYLFGEVASPNMALSPDGTRFAMIDGDRIVLWDLETPTDSGITPRKELTGQSRRAVSLAYSSDGGTIAAGGMEGGITFWDVNSGNVVGHYLPGTVMPFTALAFSSDGQSLAAGICSNYVNSVDGEYCTKSEIQLLDAKSFQSLGKSFAGYQGFISALAFNPDGELLASASMPEGIIVWDINPDNWAQVACDNVSRNFTKVEWELYFPNEEYRITCPQWPAGE
jgi:WD40 repeat protein